MTPATGSTCSRCQHQERSSAANFCSNCGAALRGPPCPGCSAPSEPGDAFCTSCGAALRKAPSIPGGPGARVPWAVSGLLGLALILMLVLRIAGTGRDAEPTSQPVGALGPTSAVPLASMTPREAAERLFERVMVSVEGGDQAQANLFLPMAIAAYDRIAALTLDDRFHLSLLHAAAGDGPSAVAVAEAGLAVRPSHLLCLAAAAEGAALMEDEERATTHYRTLLDVYDEESVSGLTEYSAHADLLGVLRGEATAYLDGTR